MFGFELATIDDVPALVVEEVYAVAFHWNHSLSDSKMITEKRPAIDAVKPRVGDFPDRRSFRPKAASRLTI